MLPRRVDVIVNSYQEAENMMSTTTPGVVSNYLKAADEGDLSALTACFTDDGTVLDEGRTYRGRDEIRAWRESLRSQWEFTTTITGSEPQPDGGYLVRTHVEGNFPGGVADLSFRFTLAGALISDLTII
jgi:ketosteroid isomerase-like protein